MTCIVYRDGVLATDSQVVSRSYICAGAYKKPNRREVEINGEKRVYLFAGSGETAYCDKFARWVNSDEFVKWLEDRSTPGPQIDPAGSDEVCCGLLFHPDGVCTRFEGNYPPFDVKHDFYAIGTGDHIAMGALQMGATPQQAVEAAILYDTYTNGPVQVVTV